MSRAVARMSVAAGLVTMLAAAAPVPIGTGSPVDAWHSPAADSAAPQFATLPNGDKILSSSVLTPRSMMGTSFSDTSFASGLTPMFWQNAAVVTGLLFALFMLSSGVRFGAVVLNRRRARDERMRVSERRIITIREEGPARICRNPVPSLDEITTIDAWPSMTQVSAWQGAAPSRRASTVEGAVVEQASSVMASYRFYAMNAWGVVDSGTGGRFESDAAAIAHGHRIADDCRVEVWRGGQKLKTIDGARSVVEYGRPSYA